MTYHGKLYKWITANTDISRQRIKSFHKSAVSLSKPGANATINDCQYVANIIILTAKNFLTGEYALISSLHAK